MILDTDIGTDCDDAGALAVLHSLRARGEVDILAVMHCTSSRWGAGCIDAINTYYGCPEIPVGTLKDRGLLDDEQSTRYHRHITLNFPNKYVATEAKDAVKLYREILSLRNGPDTVLVAIGPLRNLRNLLLSEPDQISPLSGQRLVKDTVANLVVMGGCFVKKNDDGSPSTGYIDAEWNIQMDIDSAKTVVDLWPGPVDFCGFEIGFEIVTGSSLKSTSRGNPVRRAYELHTPSMRRYSWDPATVLYAVRGACSYWDTSPYGHVRIDDTGRTIWRTQAGGLQRYLLKKADRSVLEAELNNLMKYDRARPPHRPRWSV